MLLKRLKANDVVLPVIRHHSLTERMHCTLIWQGKTVFQWICDHPFHVLLDPHLLDVHSAVLASVKIASPPQEPQCEWTSGYATFTEGLWKSDFATRDDIEIAARCLLMGMRQLWGDPPRWPDCTTQARAWKPLIAVAGIRIICCYLRSVEQPRFSVSSCNADGACSCTNKCKISPLI